MVRHIRTLFCALLLAIVLYGCQFGETPGSVENENTPAGQPSGMLTFAASKFSRSSYQPIVEAFNALQRGYSVQFVPLDDSAYLGPDAAALLASTADTSVILPGIGETNYASYFLDLQPLVNADSEFGTGDYLPGVLEACQSDGQKVGLPLSVSPSLIYYNPDAFASTNLTYPQPGWTWDDFRNAASMLAEAGGEGTFGFAPHGEPVNLLAPFVKASLDRTGGELDAADIAASIDWYVDLARRGAVPGSPGEQNWIERDRALIEAGKTAMWVDTAQNLVYWRSLLGQQVSVAPFPISQGDASGSNPATAVCSGISSGASDRQAAWVWLKFLSRRPVAHQAFYFPASIEALSTDQAWQGLEVRDQEPIRFALEHGTYGDPFPQALQAAGEALEMAVAGNATLEAALAAAGQVSAGEEAPDAGLTPVIVNTPQPTVPAGEIARISYYGSPWVHFSPRSLDALAAEFNQAHPETQLRVMSELPVGPGLSINMAAMADHVDCYAWPFTPLEEWVGSFYSLDELLQSSPTLHPSDYDSSVLEAFRIDGRLYGLPASTLPHVIYYNAERLEEVGITIPDIDWSFEDFFLMAERLSGEDAFGFVPYQGDYLDFLLAGRGVNWFNPQREPAFLPLDSPDLLSAVEWLVEQVEAGVIPPVFGPAASGERERLVESGRASMWNQYAFLTTEVEGIVPSEYKVGVAPPPLLPGLLPPPVLSGLYISRQSQEPEACWQWLSFLSEQPGAFSGVPARIPVAHSQDWENIFTRPGDVHSLASVYREAASRPALQQRPDPFIRRWLEQAVQSAVTGQDPALALAQAQSKAYAYQSCVETSGAASLELSHLCAQEVDPTIEEP